MLTSYEATALDNVREWCSDVNHETATAADYENCYCGADIYTISKACNITENQAKGVLSSLVKKGLVVQHDEDYNFMINLTEKGFNAMVK
jgi:hypothetical protein